jgi:hypothetical protein
MGIFAKWRKRSDRQPDAIVSAPLDPPGRGEGHALVLDPMELQQNQAWIDSLSHHSPYATATLEAIAGTPWGALFPRYFTNQSAIYLGRRRKNRFDPGYDIVMRETKKQASKAAQKKIEEIARWTETCGDFRDEMDRFTRPSFEQFVRMVERDSTIFDLHVYEISRDRGDKPACFEAVDAGTIFRVRPKGPRGLYNDGDAAYVQVINGQKVAWFGPEEMAFAVRAPSTSIRAAGYGRSEYVEGLSLVNMILMGVLTNKNMMQSGGPPGVLNVTGNITKEKFDALVRGIRYLFSGFRNAGRTPVVGLPDGTNAAWIQMGTSNLKDMQHQEGIWFWFQTLCGLFGVAPGVLGFPVGSHGVSSSLGEKSVLDEAQVSEGRSVAPHVFAIEASLNKWVFHPRDEDFEIRAFGLDGRTEKEQAELDEIRLRTYARLKEIRAENDLPADEYGDTILNPTYEQHRQNVMANEQQDQGGGPRGPGGPGPGPGPGQGPEGGEGPGGEAPQPGIDPMHDWGPEFTEKSLTAGRRPRRRFTIEVP